MPYAVRKTDKGYGVVNTDTGKWKSKNTSKEKAEAQIRLLRGVEHSGGKWKPTGKRKQRRWGKRKMGKK